MAFAINLLRLCTVLEFYVLKVLRFDALSLCSFLDWRNTSIVMRSYIPPADRHSSSNRLVFRAAAPFPSSQLVVTRARFHGNARSSDSDGSSRNPSGDVRTITRYTDR